MANLNFKEDLNLSKIGENVVRGFLEKQGGIFINDNDDYKYDLAMTFNGKVKTYEIKTDFKCAKGFDTGNLFVEYQSRKKPSGISTTEAEWFVTYFIYLDELWFIKTSKLRELLQRNNFPTFLDAGDIDSATHGYLIKRKDFKQYFNVCQIKT
jgi:hypothetical protein